MKIISFDKILLLINNKFMKPKIIEIKLPIGSNDSDLEDKIKKYQSKYDGFTILNKSLDARNKNNIFWNIRVETFLNINKKDSSSDRPLMNIKYNKNKKKILIIGSGPAGFFSGLILQQSGFNVEIIEQGDNVDQRKKDIIKFETTGILNESSNYTNGEGGAGTFSDGKLTARSKKIKKEKQFIFDTYVEAGAPEEIKYLSNPHLGSDNLKIIVKNLRNKFIDIGGVIHFNTEFINFYNPKKKVISIKTNKNHMECDNLILAIGHSSYNTYRTLLDNGVPFRTKPFAIGSRVEHQQETINKSQWGKSSLQGMKAAEYRLTFKSDHNLPVYSFCMCPGGRIVPSSSNEKTNIVNGMSNYSRGSRFANSAIVAAVDLNKILNKEVKPNEALDWLYKLENKFFNIKNNYSAPANRISDLLIGRQSSNLPKSSYPFDLYSYDFKELFPPNIYNSLISGIKDFTKKISGFEEGIIMGLESKTSSPIQVKRDKQGKVNDFDNLYMIGEGSGFAGGIISSAVDGIKAALDIIDRN